MKFRDILKESPDNSQIIDKLSKLVWDQIKDLEFKNKSIVINKLISKLESDLLTARQEDASSINPTNVKVGDIIKCISSLGSRPFIKFKVLKIVDPSSMNLKGITITKNKRGEFVTCDIAWNKSRNQWRYDFNQYVN